MENRHFDPLKNKLPYNWTNSNATGYYNRAFWKRCKCEYGTTNPCKETADKWNPVATEPSKWTEGCSPCSSYYDRPRSYYYTYNPDDCGNSGFRKKCHDSSDTDSCDTDTNTETHGCEEIEYCTCSGRKWNVFSNFCKRCKKPYNNDNCSDLDSKKHCSPLKSYVARHGCNDCQDFAIVYRMIDNEQDCDNIVELKIPVGGSKEMYLAKHFSPEFIEANRFQCATMPEYNALPNNIIDNMREEEFTLSDQNALVKRGIKNSVFANQLIDEGKLIHEKHSYMIPMNVCGRTSYYYFGNCATSGSTQTGLAHQDRYKSYF